MNPKWFGDSYDIVKRFFVAVLKESGYSVFVDPLFSGHFSEIQGKFLDFIGAELKPDIPSRTMRSAILLDPDTGIGSKRTKKHITIKDFAKLTDLYSVVLSFDHSFGFNADHKKQMLFKLKELSKLGAVGFYYNSHAKFLFGSRSTEEIESVKECLKETGLPSSRIVVLD
jgi:hypothetical protein